MRLSLGDLMDSIDGTVGYMMRIFSEGLTTRNREAELYTLPGIYARPNDADESTVGTEDCVVIENGDDRIIIATKNAKAWANLIAYLSRDLDKGETVLSSEDGTARCYISARPNGDVYVKADNGTKSVTMEWDAATGDLNVAGDGDVNLNPTGLVNVGAAADFMTKATVLQGEDATQVGIYNTHVHISAAPGVPTGTPITPPAVPALQTALTAAIQSAKGKH